MNELQAQPLSIIGLTENISTRAGDELKRDSDASIDAAEVPTPASLAADLIHYKV